MKKNARGIAKLPVLVIVVLTAVLGVAFSGKFLGVKPTQQFIQGAPQEISFDGPLEGARVAIEKDPKNLEARRGLASLLFSKLSTVQREKDAERFDVLELLDTLSYIIKQEPADLGAILMMADLSFREQVYDKAAQYYEKYLAREPKDFQVKAKYGGALAYIGKHQKAIKELTPVVKENPTYFPAKVYLGVAKVGVGKKDEAVKLLTEAAQQIGPESAAGAEVVRLIAKVQGHAATITSAPTESNYATIEALLRANPILGPKIDAVSEKGDELQITVHDFPVSQMPEFARQKLLGRIADFYKTRSTMKKVRFTDAADGKELGTYNLP